MSEHVKQLNRKLSDALGQRYGHAWFCWKEASELKYPIRFKGEVVQRSWASRLGKVWVLCQWRKPEMRPDQWQHAFKGLYPYPSNGMYYPHAETAEPPGALPTERTTYILIESIRRQIAKDRIQHRSETRSYVDKREQDDYTEWVECVQDTNTAFSNPNPGSRSGNVSFGGI
jgi:hypothetical protein